MKVCIKGMGVILTCLLLGRYMALSSVSHQVKWCKSSIDVKKCELSNFRFLSYIPLRGNSSMFILIRIN